MWCVSDKGWTSILNKQKHRTWHPTTAERQVVSIVVSDNNRGTWWRVSYIDPTINVCKYWFSRFQPPQVPHSSTASVVGLSLNGPNVLCRAQSAITGEWGCCCCYPPIKCGTHKSQLCYLYLPSTSCRRPPLLPSIRPNNVILYYADKQPLSASNG